VSVQWMTSVDQFVDSAEGAASQSWADCLTQAAVEFVLPDGRRVPVSARGSDFVHFVIAELASGHTVRAESTEEMLTPDAAGEALGVTRQTIYRWQDANILPCVLQGKVRAVPAAAVARAAAERDSRKGRADALAASARTADAPVSRQEMFEMLQKAMLGGDAVDAATAWQRRRATVVAEQAAAAVQAFGGSTAGR